jgi:hypothetical protein
MTLLRRFPKLLLLLSLTVSAPALIRAESVDLPRRTAPSVPKDEAYPGVVVLYDAIRDPIGHRLRIIATHPRGDATRSPVIFVAGWLSCDSVEAPPGTADAT